MKVTYNGHKYECTKALKGPDFVHLINDNVVIAAFESVSNFDVFTIDGEWTIYDISKSSPAIVREDDTLGKSTKLPVSLVEGVDEIVDSKMGDFGNTTTFNDDAIISTYENGTKVRTEFLPDGSIRTTTTYTSGADTKIETTTFNDDGSITQSYEWR